MDHLVGSQKLIHGEFAKCIKCYKCRKLSWYHVPPLMPLPDLCWTCSRESIFGECWCEFCINKVEVLCKKCGSKTGAQCECDKEKPKEKKKKRKLDKTETEPVLKREKTQSLVDLTKEPLDVKEEAWKFIGKQGETIILPSKFFGTGPTRREHPDLDAKQWKHALEQWETFQLVCQGGGLPTGLDLKTQNNLLKACFGSVKKGKDKALFILLGRGSQSLFGYNDK